MSVFSEEKGFLLGGGMWMSGIENGK